MGTVMAFQFGPQLLLLPWTGDAAAFDAPVRQTFVAELLGDVDLSNAIARNATSFNAARMVGPTVAGLTIAAICRRPYARSCSIRAATTAAGCSC